MRVSGRLDIEHDPRPPSIRLGRELQPVERHRFDEVGRLSPTPCDDRLEVGVAALERGDAEADCFDETEALVLRFTGEVVRDAKPSQDTFEAASARFSPREIVELTLAIGYYMAIARVMEVAQIDIDEPLGDALVRDRG